MSCILELEKHFDIFWFKMEVYENKIKFTNYILRVLQVVEDGNNSTNRECMCEYSND